MDQRSYKQIFVPHEAIDSDKYLIAHFKVIPRDDLTVRDVAARLAIITSLGTMDALPYENQYVRINSCAKVITAKDEGDIRIAYPVELCGPHEGLTQLFAIMFYGASYNYTKELWVEDIDFPKSFMSRFKGPRFGVAGIRKKFGIEKRPLLGVILKPRLGVGLSEIAEQVFLCLIGGADFVVDDELFLDREGEFSFANRVSTLMDVVRRAVGDTGTYKGYIANIGASPMRAVQYAHVARKEGATGLLVNAFTMGFSAVEELINALDGTLPVTIHNMGIGILTRPVVSADLKRPTGVSDALITKISRLIGGDAVHSGISSSEWYHQEAWGPSVVALDHAVHNIRRSFPVAAGGLTIANLWENIRSLGPDVILEAGTGLLGYPHGPKLGARHFRLLIDTLDSDMSEDQAYRKIDVLALSDKKLRSALTSYGYKGNFSGRSKK